MTAAGDAITGPDGLKRCPWGTSPDIYRQYHDTEWGRVVRGDNAMFERMCLEAFQSGLSWLTILRKRPAFRAAFADFDIAAVAAFGEPDRQRLLADAGIVRNRLKIDAAIANARTALSMGPGLSDLLWSYAPATSGGRPTVNSQIPATTPESVALAKGLKKAGFRFVGPTTAYALMQATGMVDDHLAECHVHPEETAR